MKRILLSMCLLVCSIITNAQDSIPSIMVLPSDSYCRECGYVRQIKTADGEQNVPDYEKFVAEDKVMSLAINYCSGVLSERGYVVNDLVHTVKMLQAKEAETNPVDDKPLYNRILASSGTDIVVTLDYTVSNQIGPRKGYSFNIKAVDVKTDKVIAGADETTFPSNESINEQFKRFLASRIDEFGYQLMNYLISLRK